MKTTNEISSKPKMFSLKDEFMSIDWQKNVLKIEISKKVLIILGIIILILI